MVLINLVHFNTRTELTFTASTKPATALVLIALLYL